VSGNSSDNSHPHSRVVHIVGGEPSDEELAALMAVLAGLASVTTAAPPMPHSAWADLAHRLRTPLHPGSGAWRASALPSTASTGDTHRV
jgi:hypothetical protein